MTKQYKANEIVIPVKDVDSLKGIVKAYYSVIGNADSDNDIVEPGAGTKTIQERGPGGSDRIKHFKFHDPRLAPGRIKELGEDEFGGFFVSNISKSTLGRDTLIEYQEGIITEHSFGFEIIQYDIDEVGIRHIKEYRLWEVSTLSAWGANPLTSVVSVKDLESEAGLLKAINNITNRLKIGSFSDDYMERLEKEYTALAAIYESLKSKEPTNTLKDDKPNIELIENYKFKI